MKNLLIITVSTALILGSSITTAKSTVSNNKISVNSKNDKVLALSYGKNSTASVGSVNIKNTKISGNKISVNSKNSKTAAFSFWRGSTSSTGSVTVD